MPVGGTIAWASTTTRLSVDTSIVAFPGDAKFIAAARTNVDGAARILLAHSIRRFPQWRTFHAALAGGHSTSNSREPVFALLAAERRAKRIGDFDRPYPFCVLVADLDRSAQPQRIAERIREKRASILGRQNRLRMQRGWHVDAFGEIVIANEINIFGRQVGTNASEESTQVRAGPLPDVIPAFHTDVADDQFLLR